MKLNNLINRIQLVDASLSQQANKAVNQLLTIRNWLIGYYIVEFEQKGEERASYGDKLLETLAEKLKESDIKGLSYRNLNLFKAFYNSFPEILQTVSAEFKNSDKEIIQKVSEELIILPPKDEKTRGSLVSTMIASLS